MKKVLIVEDDDDIGDIVEMVLSTNYQVLVKRDSRALVEVIGQFNPDVILLDNFVGQKDATEIIREITRERNELDIPLVLFSAHPDIAIIAAQIGAVDFIAKPFDLLDLQACISRVLSPMDNLPMNIH